MRGFSASVSKHRRDEAMFVRDAYRGSGLGRRLAAAITKSEDQKYARVVLDTLPKLAPASRSTRPWLSRNRAYLASPTPGAICFELRS